MAFLMNEVLDKTLHIRQKSPYEDLSREVKDEIKEFHEACKQGDIGTVEKLLKDQAIFENILVGEISFHGQIDGSNYALECAVSRGQVKIVEILLKQESVKKELKKDCRLLNIAAGKGYIRIVELLVNAGANINQEFEIDEYLLVQEEEPGATPLHAAARNGQFEVVDFCIRNGSDINKLTYGGSSPLMLAQKAKHPEVISVLKERGAREFLKPRIDQGHLIEQFKLYLKITNSKNKKLIDYFNTCLGLCNGLSALLAWREKKGEGKLFFEHLEIISAWNGEAVTLTEDTQNIFKSTMKLLAWLQEGLGMEEGGDGDLKILDIQDWCLLFANENYFPSISKMICEFDFMFVLNRDEISFVLKLTAFKGKMIRLHSINHSLYLKKEENGYYLYNPNYPWGYELIESESQLSKVICCHFAGHLKPSYICFRVTSYDFADTSVSQVKYPKTEGLVEEILRKRSARGLRNASAIQSDPIINYSDPIINYSSRIYGSWDALHAASSIGDLSTVKLLVQNSPKTGWRILSRSVNSDIEIAAIYGHHQVVAFLLHSKHYSEETLEKALTAAKHGRQKCLTALGPYVVNKGNITLKQAHYHELIQKYFKCCDLLFSFIQEKDKAIKTCLFMFSNAPSFESQVNPTVEDISEVILGYLHKPQSLR